MANKAGYCLKKKEADDLMIIRFCYTYCDAKHERLSTSAVSIESK